MPFWLTLTFFVMPVKIFRIERGQHQQEDLPWTYTSRSDVPVKKSIASTSKFDVLLHTSVTRPTTSAMLKNTPDHQIPESLIRYGCIA
jgi:hypothetical protein